MRSLRKLEFLVDANLIGDNTLRAVPHLAQNNGEIYYRICNFECMTMTSIACYSLGIDFSVDLFLDFMDVPKSAIRDDD